MKRLLLAAILFAAVLTLPTQADFFQCPPACAGGDNDDIINGSANPDVIDAGDGNDIIFGAGGSDELNGEDDNDVIFGGADSDGLGGQLGNDTLIPGPDDASRTQGSSGGEGNDAVIIFVSETIHCQFVYGRTGFDVLHLIGFGPYIAEYPFGAAEPVAIGSFIVIQDPVAGGFIFIEVEDDMGSSIDRITGLPTPNVAMLDDTDFNNFVNSNCVQLD